MSQILVETVIILFFALIGTGLIWMFISKKKYSELFDKYGYSAGIILLLIIAVVVGLINTFF